MSNERKILTELIELYRDLPCLWDLTCEAYKNPAQKKNAWEILLSKFKEIKPDANISSIKKKIDNLKISYQREFKKVKESKNRTGSASSDVHKPNLWYYELMTFLNKKNDDKRIGVDSLVSEDEDDQPAAKKKKQKIANERDIQSKKAALIDAAHNLLRNDNETNPFGLYVGKKLDEIVPGSQRDLAEKLISDVLFFAKSNRLTFDTKIEMPAAQQSHPFPTQYTPHNQYFVPSPQQCSSSSQNSSNIFHIQIQSPPPPFPKTEHSPQYMHIKPPPSPLNDFAPWSQQLTSSSSSHSSSNLHQIQSPPNTQPPPPPALHISHTVISPPLHSPIGIQCLSSSRDFSDSVTSPPKTSPVFIQSPPSSSHTIHNPLSSQHTANTTHTTAVAMHSRDEDNHVIEGSAEILKQM